MPDDPEPLTRSALQAAQHVLSARLAAVRCQVRQLTAQVTTQARPPDPEACLVLTARLDALATEVRQILTREAALRRALTLLHVSQYPARDWRDDVPMYDHP
jgi:predicted metal-dependent HD superfamily phosphohydrolase